MLHTRWGSGLLAAVLLFGMLSAFHSKLKPILSAMATTQVSNVVTAAIQTAVADGIAADSITYQSMVTLERNDSGQITALTSNLPRVNQLRCDLVERVLAQLSELSVDELAIPIGSLTGSELLFGRGPSIHARSLSFGTVSANFEHSFADAGVNQTLHRITLMLEVNVQVFLPAQILEFPVTTEVCVAETVIVGEVPDTYLEWEY